MARETLTLILLVAALTAACGGAPAAALPTTAPAVATPAAAAAPASPPGAGAATARPKPVGVTSNDEAIRELGLLRQAYEQAQQAFARGDKSAALELMNTAYLDHFERVEPWLDQKLTEEYREQVEAAISRELRRKLRDGGSAAEIAAQFPVGLKLLGEAEEKLRKLG